MEQILINGYIREQQKLLHQQIIPNEINILIVKFYYNRVLVYYACKDKLRIIDFNYKNGSNSIMWNCKLIKLTPSHPTDIAKSTHTKRCVVNDISLSSNIKELISSHIPFMGKGRFNALFRCGGYTSDADPTCDVTIINQRQLLQSQSTNDEVCIFLYCCFIL